MHLCHVASMWKFFLLSTSTYFRGIISIVRGGNAVYLSYYNPATYVAG